jgi:hypothetical protein
MRVQPVKPITQTYYRRQKPYVLYQCEACENPGRVVEVGGEPHLLCQECIGYMNQVQKALPKPKQKPTLAGKLQEKFERMADRAGTKALTAMEGMEKHEKVCWIIIISATAMILGQGIRWWLVA